MLTDSAFLVDPTDAALRRAQARNLFTLFRAMSTLRGGALHEDARLSMHTAFPQNPMFSGVWNVRVADGEVDSVITEALDWMRTHDAHFFFWWIDADTQPTHLGEELQRRGFIANLENAHCLAIALADIHYAPFVSSGEPGVEIETGADSAASAASATLVIEEAATSNTLQDWRSVFRAAHEVPDFTIQAYLEALQEFPADAVPWRAFIGYANGEPVCSTMLIPGGGVASLYGLGTVHSARGKGYGAALARHALEVAHDMGYAHAVTFSAPEFVPFLEGLGFHSLEATMSRYLYYFAR